MVETYWIDHKRDPANLATLDKLSAVLIESGRYNEAAEALRFRLRVEPRSAEAHTLLADLYTSFGHFHAALDHRRVAAQLTPDDPDSLAWLAISQWYANDLDECLAGCGQLIRSSVASSYLHSFYLNALLHKRGEASQSLRQAHENWARVHCSDLRAETRHDNSRDTERRLRVGYLAGEFTSGPAFHFIMPLMRHHDETRFDVFCYHTRPQADEGTRQYAELLKGWRDATKLSEQSIFELIRSDRIDILVDLSGQYPHHGLRIFAMRPAPVQVTIPIYPSTTGLAAIDYVFTDRWTCPRGSEAQYSERVFRIPTGYFAYEPPAVAPDRIAPIPAERNGFVTFGMFQRPAKTNSTFWNVVARTMEQIPASRLLIHNPDRELDVEHSAAREFFVRHLSSFGIEEDRLIFRGAMPLREHLECLETVDLVFDTFPYNGQTTTCECLWMGVPVITLEGDVHVARVGTAILERVGLGSMIARTLDEYVEIASRLAIDLRTLRALRCGLRSRVKASSLSDGRLITREIETAYRDIWRQWCLEENDL